MGESGANEGSGFEGACWAASGLGCFAGACLTGGGAEHLRLLLGIAFFAKGKETADPQPRL